MTPLPPLEIISHLLNGYHLEPMELEKARQILQALSVELESRESTEMRWERRVRELEAEGATTSDAQAVADAEMEKICSWGWAKE